VAALTARTGRSNAPPDGTRNKILDSAGPVFADFGFHGATIREICARAGVNVALVNYYFGDKLELYTEVLRRSIGSAGQGILQQALKSTAPPEEAFRELIYGMLLRVSQADRPVWHFRLMVHEFANPTPAMATVIDETMRPIYERFRTIIAGMIGLPPDHDKTRLCAHSVISQIVHYVHGKHVISQLWPDLRMTPERIDEIAAHIADFSLAYLREQEQGRKRTTRKK
jgi:TetR/AcrR family transcriptional regulator, regulator of cefoperazone and chloramphenicol sensitivity